MTLHDALPIHVVRKRPGLVTHLASVQKAEIDEDDGNAKVR
jgi:hypothetical protein